MCDKEIRDKINNRVIRQHNIIKHINSSISNQDRAILLDIYFRLRHQVLELERSLQHSISTSAIINGRDEVCESEGETK